MPSLKLDDHELIIEMFKNIRELITTDIKCMVFGTALHKPAKKLALCSFEIKYSYDLKGRHVLLIDVKNKPLLLNVSRWGEVTVVGL